MAPAPSKGHERKGACYCCLAPYICSKPHGCSQSSCYKPLLPTAESLCDWKCNKFCIKNFLNKTQHWQKTSGCHIILLVHFSLRLNLNTCTYIFLISPFWSCLFKPCLLVLLLTNMPASISLLLLLFPWIGEMRSLLVLNSALNKTLSF